MKILNKIVEFIKSLISKVRKPVHVETHVTSEKKVETAKPVKRRGRPRKVKAEWTAIDL